MKGPQTLRNLGCVLDKEYRISSRYIHETMSFNHFLKQGGGTDFHSLRITLFAKHKGLLHCRGKGQRKVGTA